MHGYIIELRDSDGNDTTVLDYIVEADSAEAAAAELAKELEAEAKKREWESDGSGGYFYPCDCDNPEPDEPELPCDSCQALTINGTACHETGCPKDAAYRRAMKRYDSFECQGHGGITVGEPEEFDSLDAAEAEHDNNRYYHARYY